MKSLPSGARSSKTTARFSGCVKMAFRRSQTIPPPTPMPNHGCSVVCRVDRLENVFLAVIDRTSRHAAMTITMPSVPVCPDQSCRSKLPIEGSADRTDRRERPLVCGGGGFASWHFELEVPSRTSVVAFRHCSRPKA